MKIKIDVDIPAAPDGGKLVVVRAKDVPRDSWYFSAVADEWRYFGKRNYWTDDDDPFDLSQCLVVVSVPPKPCPDETVVLDAELVLTAIGYKDGLDDSHAHVARIQVADEIDHQCIFDHFK